MAAMISSLDSAPGASTSPGPSPSPNQDAPPSASFVASPASRRSILARPASHASKHRLSQYSNQSTRSRSRPPSHVFPIFNSSLSYTLVRDFAYPLNNALHYGPPPEPSRPPSALSTPASESQDKFYDPPTSWDSRDSWGSGEHLPAVQYTDGPPWSEDDDLQSPVVTVNRHRKHKMSLESELGRGRGRYRRDDERRNSLLGQGSREGERDYDAEPDDGNNSQGHDGGDLLTYPPEQGWQSEHSEPHNAAGQRDSHFAATLPSRTYTDETGHGYVSGSDSSASSPGMPRRDESRYSRDYQFSIASPDEEMHGKAVALFDFARENENELPLVEGQVIWVSYRHGQGWLVAMDPKTEESGLVPEEYVRMLRDIQGGLNSLTGNDQLLSPGADSGTPTQAQHSQSFGHSSTPSNGYQQPVVSMFSTSSKDLNPYPPHLLKTQAGQSPPQVIHYHGQRGGSQANTPTISTLEEGETKDQTTDDDSATTPVDDSLPDTKLGADTVAHLESPISPGGSESTEEGGAAVGDR